MKRCPSCNRTYDDSQSFCSVDGTPLDSQTPSSDPAATLASPPASNLPTPQVAYETPGYQQPYEQPYSQQWGPQPARRNRNKTLLFVVVGLLVAVGVGLTTYFLARSSSKRFVGTWVEENKPNDKGVRLTEDGKVMVPQPPVNSPSPTPSGNDEIQVGTYTVNGDKATINVQKGTFTGTLESDNRMRLEAQGKTIYLMRK